MDAAHPAAVLLVLYYLAVHLLGSLTQELICDRARAESCIRDLQRRFADVTSSAGVVDINKLEKLCVGAYRGDNLTECVLESTSPCPDDMPWQMGDTWQTIHSDIRQVCNTQCPKYQDRTKSASHCIKKIQYDDVIKGHYKTFCRALNNSHQCVSQYQAGCRFSMWAYVTSDLPGFVSNVMDVCTKGCHDVDNMMAAGRKCAKSYDLSKSPSRHERYKRCNYFTNLLSCLQMAQTKEPCLDLRDLFDKVYGNYSTHMNEHRYFCSTASISHLVVPWLPALTSTLLISLSHR